MTTAPVRAARSSRQSGDAATSQRQGAVRHRGHHQHVGIQGQRRLDGDGPCPLEAGLTRDVHRPAARQHLIDERARAGAEVGGSRYSARTGETPASRASSAARSRSIRRPAPRPPRRPPRPRPAGERWPARRRRFRTATSARPATRRRSRAATRRRPNIRPRRPGRAPAPGCPRLAPGPGPRRRVDAGDVGDHWVVCEHGDAGHSPRRQQRRQDPSAARYVETTRRGGPAGRRSPTGPTSVRGNPPPAGTSMRPSVSAAVPSMAPRTRGPASAPPPWARPNRRPARRAGTTGAAAPRPSVPGDRAGGSPFVGSGVNPFFTWGVAPTSISSIFGDMDRASGTNSSWSDSAGDPTENAAAA